ncbi:MAG: thioesterase family protein [Myxococcota bacterium]
MFEDFVDRWRPSSETRATFEVPLGWGQGRATFGGLVGAAGVALARSQTDRLLRTFHAQLLAPVVPGPLEGHLEVLREGRTTTMMEVRLLQDDRLAAVLGLTFVIERPDQTSVAGPPAPNWGPPDDLPAIPYVEGGPVPEFVQHVEMRFAEGGFPFAGVETAAFGGYGRFRDDPQAASLERTVALLDVWPSPTLSILKGPARSSSMTWTAHLLAPAQPGFHAFTYRTEAAQHGVSTVVGRLWGPDGTFLAYTEQTAAVFE